MFEENAERDETLTYQRRIFRPQEPRVHPLAIVAMVAGIASWCMCISSPVAIGLALAKAFHWPEPGVLGVSMIALCFPTISVVAGSIGTWRIQRNRKKYTGVKFAVIGLGVGAFWGMLWVALLRVPTIHLN